MCPSDTDTTKKAIDYRSAKTAPASANHSPAPTELDVDSAIVTPIEDPRLRKLLHQMEVNPLANIHDWALAFNLSNSHLKRLFKRATGVGLGQALTEKRLRRAAQLLTNTNMSIKEIACAVGYEHTSSFTRAFERRFDLAPRHFRIRNAA